MRRIGPLEELGHTGVHDLGDDGQAGLLPGLHQQVEARGAHALEGVGGGAGLKRAAPEQGRAGGLHALGHGADLRLALHRAGAGDHGEIPPADLGVPHRDHRVLRVELAVGLLVGLLHPHDPLYMGVDGDLIHVHGGGVAHQAQDGATHAVGDAHIQIQFLELEHQGVDVLLPGAGFHNNYHDFTSFLSMPCKKGAH